MYTPRPSIQSAVLWVFAHVVVGGLTVLALAYVLSECNAVTGIGEYETVGAIATEGEGDAVRQDSGIDPASDGGGSETREPGDGGPGSDPSTYSLGMAVAARTSVSFVGTDSSGS